MRSKGKGVKWIETIISTEPYPEECITWPFSSRESGYGQIFWKGIRTTSNRVTCELAHGLPPGKEYHAAHECGNRACCNPSHLSWKTPKSNIDDKKIHGTQPCGADIYNAKLNDGLVREIRERIRDGESQRGIAKQLCVSFSTVCDINKGRTWRHVLS